MPALYLFGRRTLLGGDDLHVPALVTAVVRVAQLSFLVLPLGIFLWKQALSIANANANANSNSDSTGIEWPIWRYLFDWWGEMENIDNNNNIGDNNRSPVCVESVFARYYPLLSAIHLLCTVIFCFHSLFLERKIWYWSSQGTPTIRLPRTKHVQQLLEKKVGICTVLLGLTVGCIYFVAALFFARPYHRCFHSLLDSYPNNNNNDNYIYNYNDDGFGDNSDNYPDSIENWVGSKAWYGLGALLAASQTAEVVVAALFYARLRATTDDNNENTNSDEVALIHGFHHELIEELWADRCESLFRCLSISTCFLFGGKDLLDNAQRNNSYRHVAQALADYLETKGTLDVVPTDLFTGLFVLQRIQNQRILQTRKTVFEESSTLLASALGLSRGASNHTNGTNHNNGSSSSTLIRSEHHSPKPIDDRYHQISSPDISSTGLRSRVTSSNDLMERDANSSSRSLSPGRNYIAGSTSTPEKISTPIVESSVLDHSRQPQSSSSSLIRSPLPPSQHLLQIQGLRQQHRHQKQGQRNIYRRKKIPGVTNPDVLALPSNTSDGESSAFYHATSRQVLNPSDAIDAATLKEGALMCKYALSIYTWMLYVFVHPVTGFPRLICRCGASSEGGMTDCCCKICGIRKESDIISPSSMPLHRRQDSPGATNGSYDTNNRHGEYLASSRNSSEGSEIFNEMERGVGFHSDNFEDQQHQGIFNGDCKTSGDTFCEWHKRALLLVAGIPDADLVYAEFSNKLSSVPYCILLDRERSLVVLSVRGSLSLEDIVTDTLVLPESLEQVGNKYGFDGRGQYCHAGVLACFENVMRDLQKHAWLERLLEEQYPDYSLRLVGHSLGAGVVTLMGYVLRSKYPSLKVFGYSPPGCTMTWDMANNCKSFATAFVLDSDIVPRLSVLALEGLRDEVLELIGRIKVPKHKVYQNFWKSKENQSNRRCLFGRRSGEAEDYNHEDDLDELTEIINETLDEVPSDTTYQRQLLDFLRVQDERKQARGETNSKSLRLYPPGKMVHLVRTGEESGFSHCLNQCLSCYTSNSGFVYTPVYISNDDLDEIVVTSTMGTDHFIDRMCDELHTLSDKYSSETLGNGREAAAYPCGLGSGGHQIV